MIETVEELENTVRPLIKQAKNQLKTVSLLTGRGYYVREMSGQRNLFEAVEER